MSPALTRRRLLRTTTALAISISLTGCNESAQSETTTTPPTHTTKTSPPLTPSEQHALVDITRESYFAKAWTIPQEMARFPNGDSIPLEKLNETVRAAVRTAIDSDRYTTKDASPTFIDAIEDVDLVSYNGTVWKIGHTFPIVTVRLDTKIAGSEAVDNRTVKSDSEYVWSNDAVGEMVSTIAPQGVQTASRPYVTTRLDPAVQDFLSQYDYIERPKGIGEIVISRTNRSPPHTVRAHEATDKELYGRPVKEATEYGPPTGALIDRVIGSNRKTPINYQNHIHTTYPEDIPRQFARDLDYDSNYVRVDDELYGFDTRHVHWDEFPLQFQAAVVSENATIADPIDIQLSLQNSGDETVQLQMQGLAPFGVLWAYGTGGEYVLWNDAYENSENVVIENGSVVPEFTSRTDLVPGQSLSETYRLGHDRLEANKNVQSGTYEVLGTVWASWPTYDGAEEYDWRSQLFPYTLSIEVLS